MTPFAIPFWKDAPFLRLLFPFVTGIILQLYGVVPVVALYSSGALLLSGILAFLWLSMARQYQWQWVQGLLLHLLLIVIAALLTWLQDPRHSRHWLGKDADSQQGYRIRINAPVVKKSGFFKTEAICIATLRNDTILPVKGNLIVYIAADSTMPLLAYGDELLVSAAITPIRNTANPGGFNYAEYAARQQVFHTLWIKRGEYRVYKRATGFSLMRWLQTVQVRLLTTLRQYIPGREAQGVAEALLIGYKVDLDADLVEAYTKTGIIHIIAISGLHLGLLYWLLVKLMGLLPGIRRWRWVRLTLLLSGLWCFSLLTGASASVLRSALMFSVIAAGECIGRRSSIYNSMAASAVGLLAFDPYILLDLGFQLSYLAVLGIVLLHPMLNRLFYFRQRWLRYLWTMCSISISAQLLTTPICLYHFHQFPLSFLIANLVAVPASSGILFGEIALLLLSWWPAPAEWIGMAIGWSLDLLNMGIRWLSQLPFTTITGIPATGLSTMLLYALLAMGLGWLSHKKPGWLLGSLALLTGWVATLQTDRLLHQRQQQIVVYHLPKAGAIDCVQGNQYWSWGDSSTLPGQPLYYKYLLPSRQYQQATTRAVTLPGLWQQGAFWCFGGKRIVIVDSSFRLLPEAERIAVDLVVLSRSPDVDIAALDDVFDAGLYVFDLSNPVWKINRWKKECDQLLLRCHVVKYDGALVVNVSP
jgi:competence protein ComEC